MNDEQRLIWDYLRQHAVGINNAIHVNQIAENLEFPPHGTNNDNVRGWIKDMVVTHHLPIGTCKRGAFLFINPDERERAARFVERRTRADIIRAIDPHTP